MTTDTARPTIGLIGGLGVGAGIHYYRELAARHDDARQPLQLVMAHASIARATGYATAGDRQGLAVYLAGLLSQLKAGGATVGVIPAVTPHLCIDELTPITPLPIIDITRVVADEVHKRRLAKVALFGTRFVIESNMFGRLGDVEIVRPRDAEVDFIHDAYIRLARTGIAVDEDRARFVALADTLQARDSVDAILLAGTDLALLFDSSNTPFPHLDCAQVHIEAILQRA